MGLCNNVFPIVLSTSGLRRHMVNILTSTPAQLISQHSGYYLPNTQANFFRKQAENSRIDCNKVQYFVRRSLRMLDMLISSDSVYFSNFCGLKKICPGGRTCDLHLHFRLESLREIAGLSVLQVSAVSLAGKTPCTNIEDL